MATLHQPQPLSHPAPQPTSQPPRKKLRTRNAKPKLTLEQITQDDVVQSALRIGRRARANLPKPGEEPHALEKLLIRMAGWAHHVAPEYSLAEFVVAAQGIAGNRELRPMLGAFRLAELREVTDDGAIDPNKDNVHEKEDGDRPEQVPQPDAGLVHADVGPVEADVGPDDDDWDELDIVPDEAVEVRPVPNLEKLAPTQKEHAEEHDKLSPDVEATIEQKRLAAREKRRETMARLSVDRATDKPQEQSDASHTNANAGAEKDTSEENGDASSTEAREKGRQVTEAKEGDGLNPEKSNAEATQKNRKASDTKLLSSEKGAELSHKPESDNEERMERMKTLRRALSEEEDAEVANVENANSVSKEDNYTEKVALSQTDPSKRLPQLSDSPQKTGERGSESGSRPTKASANICKDKADSRNLKECKQTTGASNDEDIDMEILAEFKAGDEV